MPSFSRMQWLCAGLLLCSFAAVPLAAQAQDAAGSDEGKQVFTAEAAPPCGVCHTLSDAEAAGTLGPNLDDLKPTEDRVRAAVSGGIGVMPPYADTLSEEQIDAVSRYVAAAVAE